MKTFTRNRILLGGLIVCLAALVWADSRPKISSVFTNQGKNDWTGQEITEAFRQQAGAFVGVDTTGSDTNFLLLRVSEAGIPQFRTASGGTWLELFNNSGTGYSMVDPTFGGTVTLSGTTIVGFPLSGVPLGVARPLAPALIGHAAVGNGVTTVNVSMAAGSIVHAVRKRTVTPFSGAGLTTAVVDVGIAGLLETFITDYDLVPAAGATNIAIATGVIPVAQMIQPTTAAFNVVFTLTCDADPTAGSVEYIIFYTPMA